MLNFLFILFDNETVSLPILELNIAEVSEIFNFALVAAPVLLAKTSIRELKLAVSRANRLLNIIEVSAMFNFLFILLDSETVSLPILELNIAEVSEIFNFASILFDKVIVSLKL
jgi:hypothetical protein